MSSLTARVLVFVASAAVLMLEILAGRLMAPYVGVSLETFTGVIGTILAAIAVGSWVGGLLADRRDPSRLVGPTFMLGGVLALLAPTLTAGFGSALQGQGAVAVVILTLFGFFAPAAVLSAVTPLVVKMRLQSLAQTGEVVGSFSAVGTAGALFGTFVTGFVLLATLPTRPIVLVVGLLLVALGVGLTLRAGSPVSDEDDGGGGGGSVVGRNIGPAAAGAGLAALLLVVAAGPCEWETTYSCVNVVVDGDNPSGRTLRLDLLSHSYVDLDDPLNLRFRYIRDFVSAIDAVAPEGAVHTLGVGGGGFTMPRYLAAARPGSTNVVFEIDDALVDIGRSELGLDPTAVNLTVVPDDARVALPRYLDDDPPPFDVVVGDAFGGMSVPWHLTTVEFLTLLKSSMAPGGVYVMNVIDYGDRTFARAEIATLKRLFGNVVVVTPERYVTGDGGGNFVIVASDSTIDPGAVEANLAAWESESSVHHGPELDAFVGDAPILTDDFAPVDTLMSQTR
ncbi:MAG: fused MFS/spermidine synthase [Acidimicrobiia bacterium]|nr:fused MFS/spermidine synthase [Acidimicrobiia bacterium]